MYQVNENIKNSRVKIVGNLHSTESIDLESALELAYSEDLDLVEMSEKDGVSICKIMNYSKYLYEQKKAKKAPKKSVVKDIKIGCNIADHDLQISANKAMKILNEGDKIRVIVVFKGRQVVFAQDQGVDILNRFMSFLPENVVVIKAPKLEGNMYSMMIECKK